MIKTKLKNWVFKQETERIEQKEKDLEDKLNHLDSLFDQYDLLRDVGKRAAHYFKVNPQIKNISKNMLGLYGHHEHKIYAAYGDLVSAMRCKKQIVHEGRQVISSAKGGK